MKNSLYIIVLILSALSFESRKVSFEKGREFPVESYSNTSVITSYSTDSSLFVTDSTRVIEAQIQETIMFLQSANFKTQVALKFINDYIAFCEEMDAHTNVIEWVDRQTTVTNNFKREHRKIHTEAWEEDPELGLGFDPILDAQDYPNKGFELEKVDSEFIIVKGIHWEAFKLIIRVVEEKGKGLVEGCGIINVPESKRIDR